MCTGKTPVTDKTPRRIRVHLAYDGGPFHGWQVQPGLATVTVRTEVENHAKGAQNVRVISTILDSNGKEAGKSASQPASISEWGERTYDQQIAVRQPALAGRSKRPTMCMIASSTGCPRGRSAMRWTSPARP